MSTMAGNPKRSDWYTTPQADRKRKLVSLTLSDAARERLAKLAKKRGLSKSELVEALIMETPLRERPESDQCSYCFGTGSGKAGTQ